MKYAVQIFIRWFIITIVFLFVYQVTKAQCCETFKLVRNDTTLGKGIFIIEPKPGQRARVVFEDVPIIVTSREDFTTVGSWTNATGTIDPFLNKTVSFSNTTGDQIIFNFFGSKVELITAKDKHHGIAMYQINNGAEKPVDLYSGTRLNNQVVLSEPVPAGTNTIRIRVTGQKNAAATGTYIVVDYFRVTQ